MVEENSVPEYYSDAFEVMAGPYGIVLNFSKGPGEPRVQVGEKVARIRTSWEHAKIMTFIMARHIKRVETEMGVSYPIPGKLLSDMGISKEDWDGFWKDSGLKL